MSSFNDLTGSTPIRVTAHVSHRTGIYDKAEAVAVALGEKPFSLAAMSNATPRHNTAAVTVYQPPGQEPELRTVWSPFTAGNGTFLIGERAYAKGDGPDVEWDSMMVVKDTLGNSIRSAFTPSLTVLDSQMHLIVVKPDGRHTLAHYIYIDSLSAWEYNAAWVVQPLTTASPSITAFDGLLYLAFIADGAVNVCTYTPSTTPGVRYGTWSAPISTGVKSTRAPALFTSPRRTSAELHLAAAGSDTLIKEYTMGGSIAEWTQSALQPGGTTNGGVGACSTGGEAFLTAQTADNEDPAVQYTVWTADGDTWSRSWMEPVVPEDPVPGDVTCVVFNRWLRCFYIGFADSVYYASMASVAVHGN